MTQEEEQLLLVDLCAKFPYGLLVKETLYSDSEDIYPPDRYPTEESKACVVISVQSNCVTLHVSPLGWKPEVMELRHIKPYLRPMSSMTEEELKELNEKYGNIAYFFIQEPPYYHGLQAQHEDIGSIEIGEFSEIYDWLNAHHFDYRGLIPMGLALEAPEGMYKNV